MVDGSRTLKSAGQKGGRYWPVDGIDSNWYRARFPDPARQLEMAELALGDRFVFWQPWDMEKTHLPRRVKRPIRWGGRPLGDLEWPHSLARFPFMVDLAFAFARTGRREFLEQWTRLYADYRRAWNPADRFWGNPLDTAIRAIRLVQSWDLITRQPDPPARLREALPAHLRKLRLFLHERVDGTVGNWKFIICCSILLVGDYLEIPDEEEIRSATLGRFQECCAEEINADGVEVEFAPMYQGVIILYLLEAMMARATRGRPRVPPMEQAAGTLLGSLAKLCGPDGRVHGIGDSDRFDLGYLENIWRTLNGGGAGGDAPPTIPAVQMLPATNVLALNRLWGDQTSQLFFDAAPLPPPRRRWHSHHDCLQVILFLEGLPIWVDPGRFTYTEHFQATLPVIGKAIHPSGRLGFLYRFLGRTTRDLVRRNWRTRFQARAAHNVPHTRDDQGRERPLPEAHVQPLSLLEGKGFRGATAAARDEDGHEHSRTILEIDDRVLLLVDRVHSPQPSRWRGGFHFSEDVALEKRGDGFAVVDRQRGARLFQKMVAVGGPALEVREVEGHVSPEYNRKFPAPVLEFPFPPGREALVLTGVCRPGGYPDDLGELHGELVEADLVVTVSVEGRKAVFRLEDFRGPTEAVRVVRLS